MIPHLCMTLTRLAMNVHRQRCLAFHSALNETPFVHNFTPDRIITGRMVIIDTFTSEWQAFASACPTIIVWTC